MRHAKYLSQTTVDITINDVDYILDVDNIEIGNSGIGPYEYWGFQYYDHGIDYVEDFRIKQVRDAHGFPLPKAECDEMIAQIEKDDALIEYIQRDLDERLHDMMDYGDYEAKDE